jgi:CMP-N,N'-diacetyllegionaminic acid synthase
MIINYLGIIPARSGSKGIKNKNIRKINDKECFRYTLDPLLKSNVDKIFFSTDSIEYLNLYKEYCDIKKDVTFDYLRPIDISNDISVSDDYIKDCLTILKSKGYIINNFVILQPTSLFRTKEQINDVLTYHKRCNYENIKSVSFVIQTPYYMLYEDNKMVIENKYKNRQEQKNIYILNGAYYVYSLENYNKNIQEFNKFIMPVLEGFDLDDTNDLLLIESLLKKY